ncbi:MAG: zf-HC2 domain-containing protein [Candidatus Zixiibacteriota bacterium]|nr:MAG: zf-HC2 domain-containing protein [candidate division Zixibacteria bacterium]
MNECRENRYHVMLSGYIDGELTPEETAEFERHLAGNPELQRELEAFRKLKEVTGAVKYADIPEAVWEGYWASLYRRFERNTGWILLSISVIILATLGCFYLIRDFFMGPQSPLLLKIAVGSGILGFIFLAVSAVRERIFAYKRDRYKEVQR